LIVIKWFCLPYLSWNYAYFILRAIFQTKVLLSERFVKCLVNKYDKFSRDRVKIFSTIVKGIKPQ
jgi:hypothetical protein